MPTHRCKHICKLHKAMYKPNLAKENAYPTAQEQFKLDLTDHYPKESKLDANPALAKF